MLSKVQIVLSLAASVTALSVAACSSTPKTAPTTPSDAATPINAPTATLIVHGMSCPLCANNVDKQLLTVPGVQSVRVDMGTGQVKVNLSPEARVTRRQLTDAVDKSGFTLTEVRVP